MTPRDDTTANRLLDEVRERAGVSVGARVEELLTPELIAGWVLEERQASNGARLRVTVYRMTYRLAGHEWTGEAVVPPDLDPSTLDDVSIRRLQQGATIELRKALVPDGSAQRAAEVSGRPR